MGAAAPTARGAGGRGGGAMRATSSPRPACRVTRARSTRRAGAVREPAGRPTVARSSSVRCRARPVARSTSDDKTLTPAEAPEAPLSPSACGFGRRRRAGCACPHPALWREVSDLRARRESGGSQEMVAWPHGTPGNCISPTVAGDEQPACAEPAPSSWLAAGPGWLGGLEAPTPSLLEQDGSVAFFGRSGPHRARWPPQQPAARGSLSFARGSRRCRLAPWAVSRPVRSPSEAT